MCQRSPQIEVLVNIYKLLKEPKDTSCLGVWVNYIGEFDEVIGYTVLGAIFLRSSTTNNYLILYPLIQGNNAKSYGTFESICEFESEILQTEDFPEFCLQPLSFSGLAEIESSIGCLDEEEVYYPAPHPSIGGSGELHTYKKGNVWVFSDIAGQNCGL